ncbi:hypothetical protein EG829_00570 [bacterium]|nr:hypothetical protein [bacterium]
MRAPYYVVTATCHVRNCTNYNKEFSRQKKENTYQSTSGQTLPIEKIACPVCRCWAVITRWDLVIMKS